MRHKDFFDRVAEDFGTRAWATGMVAERRAIRRWVAGHIVYRENILDVGVGNGLIFQDLMKNVSYTGIDISENMLAHATVRARQHGISFTAVRGDATSLPFSDHSFDTVICVDTFHHIPKSLQTTVLGELMRVVRPHGQILLEIKNQWNPLIMCGYLIGGKARRIILSPASPSRIKSYFAEKNFCAYNRFVTPPYICPPFMVFDMRENAEDVAVL